MKWTKLEYGKWPEGVIVMRIKDDNGEVRFSFGFITRFNNDDVWYFYDFNGPYLSIDSIYDTELHYILLNEIQLP